MGGSYLALLGLRSSTHDVDTITSLDPAMRDAVVAVAVAHGLPAGWLNSSARPWAPQGLTLADCVLLLEHEHLRVLGPPADAVFRMKLSASRAPDLDDLLQLWPRSTFTSANDVVDRYYRAYPHEERDPHLAEWVQRIIDAASRS